MNQARTARICRFPSNVSVPDSQDWRTRVDRAIATRLLCTDRLLRSQRENLALTRYRLTLNGRLAMSDAGELQRLGRQAAEYYRAHGRLLKRAERLREHVARYTASSRTLIWQP